MIYVTKLTTLECMKPAQSNDLIQISSRFSTASNDYFLIHAKPNEYLNRMNV